MVSAIIIGAGTQGQIYASYLKEAGVNLIGWVDDDTNLQGKDVLGLPVIGKFEDLFGNHIKAKVRNIYCPIGDNQIRSNYLSTLKKEGYGIPSFIHHTVSVAPDVVLGEAVYMLAGNIIMPHTTIGDYLMVNMGSTIAHHVTMGNGVFMSSGVNLGALVTVEDLAFMGMSTTIMTGVNKIGRNSLMGAGTVIIRDVPENAVMVGNPGRVLRFKE
ncbi:NeuD/PglB/VioB family sugar acetyltransferase [Flavobacteriaceae bacterium F89]|uniref:NeuD/PglB/VioB family sugar acetyltransferase n=1 Tax=Cerina litoralis TaxID=2874477 RepID=A0AAE3EWV5_9FLAO|nr:NeuD/PglB/VioB family sugar acetyltransferase [Cerina litoralis]MCG2461182.1 NeuD/PglB/VioB family sugar acetyltransferase [Cerina litoralis]